MNTTTSSTIALVTLGLLGPVACGSPAAPERTGQGSAKLLAPHALVRTGVSPKTRSALGVTEWRVYKSRREFVFTGYDAKGPVKGFAFAFAKSPSGAAAGAVKLRLLDGSRSRITIDLANPQSTAAIGPASLQLLTRAAADFATIARYAPRSVVGTRTVGLHLLAVGMNGETCADNAMAFGKSAAKCVASGSTGAGILPGLRGPCANAMVAAPDFAESCYSPNPGVPGEIRPWDPTESTPLCDPGGSGFCATNASQTVPDPTAPDPAGDPSGNAQPDDATVLTSEADVPPDDAVATEAAAAASADATCASCQGNSADLAIDDTNGGVELAAAPAPDEG